MKKLRIGQIVPLNVPIPPKKYGGTERIVDYICRELSKRGHEVFIFGTKETKTRGHVVKILEKCLWQEEIKETIPYYAYAMAVVMKEAPRLKLDVIHDHLGPFAVSLYGCLNVPMVHTLHVPLSNPRAYVYKKMNCNLISISNSQRKYAPGLNYVSTVYNCTDMKVFAFRASAKNYCLFIGELVERKGVKEAIEIAKRLDLELVIAGRIPLKVSHQINDYLFFKKHIEPELNRGKIRYVGEVDSRKAARLYGEAKVCLFIIKWEEPFGLVMIESMSTGTPVVSFARGSVPEVIMDKETGFIINSSDSDIRGDWAIKKTGIEGAVEAVKKIYSMPESEYKKMREKCRKRVADNFSSERMTEGYLEAYRKVIKGK